MELNSLRDRLNLFIRIFFRRWVERRFVANSIMLKTQETWKERDTTFSEFKENVTTIRKRVYAIFPWKYYIWAEVTSVKNRKSLEVGEKKHARHIAVCLSSPVELQLTIWLRIVTRREISTF